MKNTTTTGIQTQKTQSDLKPAQSTPAAINPAEVRPKNASFSQPARGSDQALTSRVLTRLGEDVHRETKTNQSESKAMLDATASGSLTANESSQLWQIQADREGTLANALADGKLDKKEKNQLDTLAKKFDDLLEKLSNNKDTSSLTDTARSQIAEDLARNVGQHQKILCGIADGSLTLSELSEVLGSQADLIATLAHASQDGRFSTTDLKNIDQAKDSLNTLRFDLRHNAVGEMAVSHKPATGSPVSVGGASPIKTSVSGVKDAVPGSAVEPFQLAQGEQAQMIRASLSQSLTSMQKDFDTLDFSGNLEAKSLVAFEVNRMDDLLRQLSDMSMPTGSLVDLVKEAQRHTLILQSLGVYQQLVATTPLAIVITESGNARVNPKAVAGEWDKRTRFNDTFLSNLSASAREYQEQAEGGRWDKLVVKLPALHSLLVAAFEELVHRVKLAAG